MDRRRLYKLQQQNGIIILFIGRVIISYVEMCVNDEDVPPIYNFYIIIRENNEGALKRPRGLLKSVNLGKKKKT